MNSPQNPEYIQFIAGLATELSKIEFEKNDYFDSVWLKEESIYGLFRFDNSLTDEYINKLKIQSSMKYEFLAGFVTNEILKDFKGKQISNAENKIYKFNELIDDPNQKAKEYIQRYLKLPFKYLVSVPLSDKLSNGILEQWKEDEEIVRGFSIKKNNNVSFYYSSSLSFQFKGYLESSKDPTLKSELKSFIGLLAVLDFIQIDKSMTLGFMRPMFADKLEVNDKTNERTYQLNLDDFYTKSLLRFSKSKNNPCYKRGKVYEIGFPNLDLEQQDKDEFNDKVKKFFSNLNNGSSSRVWKACKWYFDSLVTEDELESFLFGIFSLEAALGYELKDTDKNKEDPDIYKIPIGITNTLRERVSFILGKSYQNREYYSNLISDIYSTRSAIAHGGKTFLNREEKQRLESLKNICKKVLQKLILQDSGYLEGKNPLGLE